MDYGFSGVVGVCNSFVLFIDYQSLTFTIGMVNLGVSDFSQLSLIAN